METFQKTRRLQPCPLNLRSFFQDYPIFYQHLRVHYNKAGYVDYLTSTLRKSVEIPVMPLRTSWEEKMKRLRFFLEEHPLREVQREGWEFG